MNSGRPSLASQRTNEEVGRGSCQIGFSTYPEASLEGRAGPPWGGTRVTALETIVTMQGTVTPDRDNLHSLNAHALTFKSREFEPPGDYTDDTPRRASFLPSCRRLAAGSPAQRPSSATMGATAATSWSSRP
jgi:hypothetical protein